MTLTRRKLRMRNLATVLLDHGVSTLARVDRSETGFRITLDSPRPEVYTYVPSRLERLAFLEGDGLIIRPRRLSDGARRRLTLRKLSTDGLVSVPAILLGD